MRIVITGATGFIGSHVAVALANAEPSSELRELSRIHRNDHCGAGATGAVFVEVEAERSSVVVSPGRISKDVSTPGGQEASL